MMLVVGICWLWVQVLTVYKVFLVQSVIGMQFQAPLYSSRKKSDLVFYHAFTSLRRFNHLAIALQLLKTLIFIVLIPVNLTALGYSFGDLFVAFILDLVASVIGVLYQSMLAILVFGSVMSYLNLADQAKHAVPNQTVYDFSCVENCVSAEVYIAEQDISEQDLDAEGRRLHQNIAKSTIKAIIKSRFPWVKNLQNLNSVLSFISMIYTIYVLATSQLVPLDITLLSLYVVVVGLTEFQLIILCLAIVLSPLICLGLAIYCCCCAKNQEGNTIIDVELREAKESDIANAGGDCAICYMSMVPNDKIYILPCSEKHVFHCDCLRHWARVKNTCPICRAVIPMTNSEARSQNILQDPQPHNDDL